MAGEIVHIEFPSEDADRAQRFWNGLFGWEFGDSGMPGMDYRMARTGPESGAAIYQSDERGHASYYYATDDIDATLRARARARRHGRRPSRRCRRTAGSRPAPTARATPSTSGKSDSSAG